MVYHSIAVDKAYQTTKDRVAVKNEESKKTGRETGYVVFDSFSFTYLNFCWLEQCLCQWFFSDFTKTLLLNLKLHVFIRLNH